jgi:hypothetical protein
MEVLLEQATAIDIIVIFIFSLIVFALGYVTGYKHRKDLER